uniref:Chaperone protein DnaJ A6, chloroplastic n=1 Tax=Tanacetum cinerariifolium TaxID=118510 RepID=A0A699GDH1_TANCI|nr:chaperone protein DnaJ A6, chloroplastic [Tanacetum cinerariifolium]
MLQHHARQLRVPGLRGAGQPLLEDFAGGGVLARAGAAGLRHVVGKGVGRQAAVERLLQMVDGLQADPRAARFVAGGEAPAAHFHVAPVGQLDLAHAARAQRDDGAGLAVVRAQHRGMAVRFQRHDRVAGIGGNELRCPLFVVHAGQSEADGNRCTRRGGQAGVVERLGDCCVHGCPGARNAVHQAGRTAGAFGDGCGLAGMAGVVEAGQARAGAAAAAVYADEKFDHGCPGALSPGSPVGTGLLLADAVLAHAVALVRDQARTAQLDGVGSLGRDDHAERPAQVDGGKRRHGAAFGDRRAVRLAGVGRSAGEDGRDEGGKYGACDGVAHDGGAPGDQRQKSGAERRFDFARSADNVIMNPMRCYPWRRRAHDQIPGNQKYQGRCTAALPGSGGPDGRRRRHGAVGPHHVRHHHRQRPAVPRPDRQFLLLRLPGQAFRRAVQARGRRLLVPHRRRHAVGSRNSRSDGQRRHQHVYFCGRRGRGHARRAAPGHHHPGGHALHADRHVGLSGARVAARQPHRVFRHPVQDLLRKIQAAAAGAAAPRAFAAKIGDAHSQGFHVHAILQPETIAVLHRARPALPVHERTPPRSAGAPAIPDNCKLGYIFNPKLTVEELLLTICDEFGVQLPPQGAGAVSVKESVGRSAGAAAPAHQPGNQRAQAAADYPDRPARAAHHAGPARAGTAGAARDRALPPRFAVRAGNHGLCRAPAGRGGRGGDRAVSAPFDGPGAPPDQGRAAPHQPAVRPRAAGRLRGKPAAGIAHDLAAGGGGSVCRRRCGRGRPGGGSGRALAAGRGGRGRRRGAGRAAVAVCRTRPGRCCARAAAGSRCGGTGQAGASTCSAGPGCHRHGCHECHDCHESCDCYGRHECHDCHECHECYGRHDCQGGPDRIGRGRQGGGAAPAGRPVGPAADRQRSVRGRCAPEFALPADQGRVGRAAPARSPGRAHLARQPGDTGLRAADRAGRAGRHHHRRQRQARAHRARRPGRAPGWRVHHVLARAQRLARPGGGRGPRSRRRLAGRPPGANVRTGSAGVQPAARRGAAQAPARVPGAVPAQGGRRSRSENFYPAVSAGRGAGTALVAERQLGHSPTIHAPTLQAGAQAATGARLKRPVVLALAGMAVAIAVLLALVLRPPAPSAVPAVATAPSGSTEANVPNVPNVPNGPAAPAAPASPPAPAATPAAAATAALPAPVAALPPPVATSVTPVTQSTARTEPAAAPALPTVAGAAAKPSASPAAAAKSEEPVLNLRELPEPIQRAIPQVAVGGYIYSKNPADRLLLVDKILRREGEEVAPGLLLEKLHPKEAVFSFKGYRYRLRHRQRAQHLHDGAGVPVADPAGQRPPARGRVPARRTALSLPARLRPGCGVAAYNAGSSNAMLQGDSVMHQHSSTPLHHVLGVIGTSGSGKTTLLEFLIGQLAARGLKVNVIKHSHHDLELEPPGKDSARLRMAGAAEVMVASPFRFAIVHELRGAPEPALEDQLARLSPADITLLEGFKKYPIDKLEVYRRDQGRDPLYPLDAHVIAVASDLPRPADLPDSTAWLDLNAPLAGYALKEVIMDVTSIAQTATTIAETGNKQAVGIAVLKKAQDIQASSASALIEAIPPVPSAPRLPAHLAPASLPPHPTPKNATAWPRPARTTAPRPTVRTAAPARRKPTMPRSNGSTFPRAPANRPAARRRRPPSKPPRLADTDTDTGATGAAAHHGRGSGLARSPSSPVSRAQAGRRLARSPYREFPGSGRLGMACAATAAARLSAQSAWRGTGPRFGARIFRIPSAARAQPGAVHGTVAGVRAPVLGRRGRPPAQRPAADHARPRDARPAVRARAAGAGRLAAATAAGKCVHLRQVSSRRHDRSRIHGGAGRAHRLRAATRYQQPVREPVQPRRGCAGGAGRHPPRHGGRAAPGRTPGHAAGRDRSPWRGSRGTGVGAVPARAGPLRRGADADRMGHRYPAAGRAAGGGGPGSRDAGAPCGRAAGACRTCRTCRTCRIGVRAGRPTSHGPGHRPAAVCRSADRRARNSAGAGIAACASRQCPPAGALSRQPGRHGGQGAGQRLPGDRGAGGSGFFRCPGARICAQLAVAESRLAPSWRLLRRFSGAIPARGRLAVPGGHGAARVAGPPRPLRGARAGADRRSAEPAGPGAAGADSARLANGLCAIPVAVGGGHALACAPAGERTSFPAAVGCPGIWRGSAAGLARAGRAGDCRRLCGARGRAHGRRFWRGARCGIRGGRGVRRGGAVAPVAGPGNAGGNRLIQPSGWNARRMRASPVRSRCRRLALARLRQLGAGRFVKRAVVLGGVLEQLLRVFNHFAQIAEQSFLVQLHGIDADLNIAHRHLLARADLGGLAQFFFAVDLDHAAGHHHLAGAAAVAQAHQFQIGKTSDAGTGHVDRYDPLVELFGRHVAERQCRLLQGRAFVLGFLGDGRGLVVADVRRQRGDQHQRALHQLGNAPKVGLDPVDAMLLEAAHAVGQQARALQEVVGDQRLVHIELEVARRATHGDRHVVAEYLAAQHGHRFALGGVDLARHDGAARLVFGNRDFTEARARAGRHPAHVVGDFHQRRGQGFERAMGGQQRVVARQRGEFVLGSAERQRERVLQLGGDAVRIFRVSVEAGTDGGAARRQLQHAGQGVLDRLLGKVEMGHIAREFLAQRERGGVLQVGAADLDDVGKRLGLGLQAGAQLAQAGQHVVGQRLGGSHVDRGGEDVVRRLALVDVVVRVQQARFAAHAAHQLGAAVGQHLVHVHVGLGAGTGLPHGQRKFRQVLVGQYFVGGLGNGYRLGAVEQAQVEVDAGGGALDAGQGVNQLGRHALAGNVEMLEGALRLRAPQLFGGYVDGTKTVFFAAGTHKSSFVELPLRTGDPKAGFTMTFNSTTMQRLFSDNLLRLLACAALLAPATQAAELGEVAPRSYIGQPLSADIELALAPDEVNGLQARLAEPDVYRGANIVMNPALSSVRMAVVKRDNKQFLHVTTTGAVKADYVHVYVELSAGGRRDIRLATVWLQPDPNPAPPPPPVVAAVATAATAPVPPATAAVPASAAPQAAGAGGQATAPRLVRDRTRPAPMPSVHESEVGGPGGLKAAAAQARPSGMVSVRDIPERISEALGSARAAATAKPGQPAAKVDHKAAAKADDKAVAKADDKAGTKADEKAAAKAGEKAAARADNKAESKPESTTAEPALPAKSAHALLALPALPLPAGVKRAASSAAPAACAPSGITSGECKALDVQSQALSTKLAELEGKIRQLQVALAGSGASAAAAAVPVAATAPAKGAPAQPASAPSLVSEARAATPAHAAAPSAGAEPSAKGTPSQAGSEAPSAKGNPMQAGAEALSAKGAQSHAEASSASAAAAPAAGGAPGAVIKEASAAASATAHAAAEAASANAAAPPAVAQRRVLPKLKYKKEKPPEEQSSSLPLIAGGVGAALLAVAGAIYFLRRKKSGAGPLKIWQGFRKKQTPAQAETDSFLEVPEPRAAAPEPAAQWPTPPCIVNYLKETHDCNRPPIARPGTIPGVQAARPETRHVARQTVARATGPVERPARCGGRLSGCRWYRWPQLRRRRRPAGSACTVRPAAERAGRPGGGGQQRQPVADARCDRLRAVERPARQRAVGARAGDVPVPGARLRPPLRHLRNARHQNDQRADERRRPGHGLGGATGGGRRQHQGHVVRAQVQQPGRRGVFRRRGAAPGRDGHCRPGLYPAVGRRLSLSPPGRTEAGSGGHPRRLRPGRQSRPRVRVCVVVQGDVGRLRHCRAGVVAGQYRLVEPSCGHPQHRPGQDQPAAPRAPAQGRGHGGGADGTAPRAAQAQVRRRAGAVRAVPGQCAGRALDPSARRLLHRPGHSRWRRQTHGRAGQGSWDYPDARRRCFPRGLLTRHAGDGVHPRIGQVADFAVVGHDLFQQVDLAQARGAVQGGHAGGGGACDAGALRFQLAHAVPVAHARGGCHLIRQAGNIFVHREDFGSAGAQFVRGRHVVDQCIVVQAQFVSQLGGVAGGDFFGGQACLFHARAPGCQRHDRGQTIEFAILVRRGEGQDGFRERFRELPALGQFRADIGKRVAERRGFRVEAARIHRSGHFIERHGFFGHGRVNHQLADRMHHADGKCEAGADDQRAHRDKPQHQHRILHRPDAARHVVVGGVGQTQQLGAQYRVGRQFFGDIFGRDAGLVETADELLDNLGRGRQRSRILEQCVEFHLEVVRQADYSETHAHSVVCPVASTFTKECIMNKDQVKGTAKEIGGKIQEGAGKVVGSSEQQAKGLNKQAEGKVQKGVLLEEGLDGAIHVALRRAAGNAVLGAGQLRRQAVDVRKHAARFVAVHVQLGRAHEAFRVMGVVQRPVGHRRHRHAHGDLVRALRQQAQRHEAAIAPAEHADVLGIDKALLAQPFDAGQLIFHFDLAHVQVDGIGKSALAAARTTVVQAPDHKALLRHVLVEQVAPFARHVLRARAAVRGQEYRVFLGRIETGRLGDRVVQRLAVFRLDGAVFGTQVRIEVFRIRMVGVEFVMFEPADHAAVGTADAHLRRRVRIRVRVHEHFAIAGKVRVVPAVALRDAGRLVGGGAVEFQCVGLAVDHRVAVRLHEYAARFFIDGQQAIDAPFAARDRVQQLAVHVVQRGGIDRDQFQLFLVAGLALEQQGFAVAAPVGAHQVDVLLGSEVDVADLARGGRDDVQLHGGVRIAGGRVALVDHVGAVRIDFETARHRHLRFIVAFVRDGGVVRRPVVAGGLVHFFLRHELGFAVVDGARAVGGELAFLAGGEVDHEQVLVAHERHVAALGRNFRIEHIALGHQAGGVGLAGVDQVQIAGDRHQQLLAVRRPAVVEDTLEGSRARALAAGFFSVGQVFFRHQGLGIDQAVRGFILQVVFPQVQLELVVVAAFQERDTGAVRRDLQVAHAGTAERRVGMDAVQGEFFGSSVTAGQQGNGRQWSENKAHEEVSRGVGNPRRYQTGTVVASRRSVIPAQAGMTKRRGARRCALALRKLLSHPRHRQPLQRPAQQYRRHRQSHHQPDPETGRGHWLRRRPRQPWRRQAQPAADGQRETPERQHLDLHRLARHLIAAQRARCGHLRGIAQLEQRCKQQQVRAQRLHRRVRRVRARDLVAAQHDKNRRQHAERERHPHAHPRHEPRPHRLAFAHRLSHARDQRDAKAERHHEHQRCKIERDLVRRNLHHAIARHQQAHRAKCADLGKITDPDRHPEAQHRTDFRPVRPLPVRERIRGAVGGRVFHPGQHGRQHDPHAQRGRYGAAHAAQLRHAPVAEHQQPVDAHVDQQSQDGNDHHRPGFIDAGAVAVQRAVRGKRRQAQADDVHEQLGLVLHVRRQRLPHRVRYPGHVAGAGVVRDDAVNGHHGAAHGDQDDGPDRRAQRHGRQFVGAGVAGHGNVGHAHAHRGQLADQHGPGQLPQGGGFGADVGEGERVRHRRITKWQNSRTRILPLATLFRCNFSALAGVAAHAGEIALFTDDNFRGPSITLRDSVPDLVRRGFNDRASSVVVRSGTWELCEHANFGGQCRVLERGEYRRLEGFNDEVSSVREIQDRGGDRGRDRGDRNGWGGGGRGDRRDESVTMFEQADFRGRQVELNRDIRTLNDVGFNDRAGSIIVRDGGALSSGLTGADLRRFWGRLAEEATTRTATVEYKDYYQTLGVAKTASEDDIKKAYRKLVRKYHPDVSKEPDAQKKTQDLNEAYGVLGDAEKRAAYDDLGRGQQYRAGQEFRPPPGWGRGTAGGMGGQGGQGFGNADPSDFFSDLFANFGGRHPQDRPDRGRARRARPYIHARAHAQRQHPERGDGRPATAPDGARPERRGGTGRPVSGNPVQRQSALPYRRPRCLPDGAGYAMGNGAGRRHRSDHAVGQGQRHGAGRFANGPQAAPARTRHSGQGSGRFVPAARSGAAAGHDRQGKRTVSADGARPGLQSARGRMTDGRKQASRRGDGHRRGHR